MSYIAHFTQIKDNNNFFETFRIIYICISISEQCDKTDKYSNLPASWL
jgi:hypothetical protein